MDIDLYTEAIEYELLTKSVYQAILDNAGQSNIDVKHNVDIAGRSGVKHQVDVLWHFRLTGIEHRVIIECKNYSSTLTLEKVRNFFAILHDIGNTQGIMVTRTGYQSGVVDFAKYYGISLKILRKPNEEDWKGKLRTISININAKVPVSTQERPLKVEFAINPINDEQRIRLQILQDSGRLNISGGPSLRFVDSKGLIVTEEMRWWLPAQLQVLDKEAGGPYRQEIELDNLHIILNEGQPGQEILHVPKITAEYYIDSYKTETILHGEDIVQAILKDNATGEVEHVHRSQP